MNWDAIGAIGETVGAFAVVATLIYLAIQTKQTREAVQAGGTLSTMEIFSRWRTALVQSPDLSNIAAKANAGEKLDAQEQIKFSLFCDEMFFAVTVSYATSHQSLINACEMMAAEPANMHSTVMNNYQLAAKVKYSDLRIRPGTDVRAIQFVSDERKRLLTLCKPR